MIKEILSVLPTFTKFQWMILTLQFILLGVQTYYVTRAKRCWETAKDDLNKAENIYEFAIGVRRGIEDSLSFRDTTFCTCESCTNRECTRKLTRLVLFDAGMMGVPVRVKNFYGSCHDYTEVEEDAVL